MSSLKLQPIAQVRTCYPDKFGVPRQPGMVPSARGRVVFEEVYRREEAVRGLEGFSHVWIVFLFDQVKEDEVRLRVRPPRLGGNEKLGVFATRSPYRPNRIGLSVCKLEGIDLEGADRPVLVLSGVDLVDGTPVLDVKPYLPYVDRVEEATGAFADGLPERMTVEIGAGAEEVFSKLPGTMQGVIRESLQWDARPAYHEEERTYFLRVREYDVAWEVRDGVCRVVRISVY